MRIYSVPIRSFWQQLDAAAWFSFWYISNPSATLQTVWVSVVLPVWVEKVIVYLKDVIIGSIHPLNNKHLTEQKKSEVNPKIFPVKIPPPLVSVAPPAQCSVRWVCVCGVLRGPSRCWVLAEWRLRSGRWGLSEGAPAVREACTYLLHCRSSHRSQSGTGPYQPGSASQESPPVSGCTYR